jgi:hypothetical protein
MLNGSLYLETVLHRHCVMVLGCLTPIAAIFFLPVFGVDLGGGFLLFLFVLCPLSHLFIMQSKSFVLQTTEDSRSPWKGVSPTWNKTPTDGS